MKQEVTEIIIFSKTDSSSQNQKVKFVLLEKERENARTGGRQGERGRCGFTFGSITERDK